LLRSQDEVKTGTESNNYERGKRSVAESLALRH